MWNPGPFLLDVLFPKVCTNCGDPFREGLSNILCSPCFESIPPYEAPYCIHCGVPLAAGAFAGSERPRCRDCGECGHRLDLVRAYGDYGGALRTVHHAFKFEGMGSLGAAIASKMAGMVPVDCSPQGTRLVPVPQSPDRERERGYNPALLLADDLSDLTGIPWAPLLEKTRSTRPQMSLTREERKRNPKDAYRLRGRGGLPAKVLLVDDVFTTGSTLEECAKALKAGGVPWVGALVFGRTPHR